jgi:hypothetical protein
LVLGYRDGHLELLPTDAEKPKPAYSFEQAPSSAVLRIVPGPMQTIVVGYANGVVGLWNLDDGMPAVPMRMGHRPPLSLL